MTDVRDLLIRAAWTFVAVALTALTASGTLDLNVSALQAAGLAGLSAVATIVIRFARQKLGLD